MGKITERLRKLPAYIDRTNGFSKTGAEMWFSGKRNDLSCGNGVSKARKKRLHRKGYYSWHVNQKGFGANKPKECISDKDYAFLHPYNSTYAKWVNDAITFRYILHDDAHLLKYYYQIILRDEKPLLIPLPDLPEGYECDYSDLLRLLDEKGELLFAPSSRGENEPEWHHLSAVDGQYCVDRTSVSRQELMDLLTGMECFYQLMEYPGQNSCFDRISGGRMNRLRLTVFNEHGDDPVIGAARIVWSCSDKKCLYSTVDLESGRLEDSYIEGANNVTDCRRHPDTQEELAGAVENWQELMRDVRKTCLSLREAEYFDIDILLTQTGYAYLSFDAQPALSHAHVPGKELQEYLMRKAAFKRTQPKKGAFAMVHTAVTDKLRYKIFCEPGFARYWANDWANSLVSDFFQTKGVSIKDKLWCYKRGFFSYRKPQYGLNEDNWRNIISDYRYKWLCPINNNCYTWIDDKMTYRRVMERQKEHLPKYYYHIVKRSGKMCIIPTGDLPEGYSADTDGILALLRDKGMLALKQSSGSHGDGFFKLSYEDGTYYINGNPSCAEAIIERLETLSCFYVLTEFLVLHDELRRIYSRTVNTIRVMAFNRDGVHPKVMHAYMRIGAGGVGFTDNVGYGGMFCKIDKQTGRFYEAEQLKDHVIVPCPVHPDSGVLIEGYVPMWDEVLRVVCDFCRDLPQLEYLGFDVAVTTDGVKILEVNKHQDLHRSHLYGDEIQDFFKEKIEQKKARCSR